MKKLLNGLNHVPGFKSAGISCGIKKSGKMDLGILISDRPAVTAAVMTTSSVKAAPLLICKEHLAVGKRTRAVIVNSGNANCYTGAKGRKDAIQMCAYAANVLGIPREEVLVASTGIIGKPLPIDKITPAVPDLIQKATPSGGQDFAASILTTDTFPKQSAVRFSIEGHPVTIGAVSKGSGMIAPNMATMLGFIATDAVIRPDILLKALREVTEKTFNCITVDGCISTNDMVSVMANGSAAHSTITRASGPAYDSFKEALRKVCLSLAKDIVKDGEGATKFITVDVHGAQSDRQAKLFALAVANSMLVKTAAFGENPNWGRVAAAIGSLGVPGVDESSMKISCSSFEKPEITIKVKLSLGEGKAQVFTSDLSYDYVKINAEYN